MSFFSPVDNKRGRIEQVNLLPVIRKIFNRDIKIIENDLAIFDYECDKYCYELKTRTNTRNKYPTTLIGRNKTESDKKIIFLFKFTDCLCYIKYKKEIFDTFEVKKFNRNVKASNKSDYIYIPIEHLKIIESFDEICFK
jgi:hypothetical protein